MYVFSARVFGLLHFRFLGSFSSHAALFVSGGRVVIQSRQHQKCASLISLNKHILLYFSPFHSSPQTRSISQIGISLFSYSRKRLSSLSFGKHTCYEVTQFYNRYYSIVKTIPHKAAGFIVIDIENLLFFMILSVYNRDLFSKTSLALLKPQTRRKSILFILSPDSPSKKIKNLVALDKSSR